MIASQTDDDLRPEDFLHFIELDEFFEDWSALGLDLESDLWDLQNAIMRAPAAAPVIPGTGGLRKRRFAPSAWRKGKSGAVRVCYVYFPEFAMVLLVVAYGKNEKDNLSEIEKQGIRSYISQAEDWLRRRSEKLRGAGI